MTRTKTEIDQKLISLLQNICDDKDYIFGIFVYAQTQEERQQIIDFIEKGDDVDMETVCILALEICDKRHGKG